MIVKKDTLINRYKIDKNQLELETFKSILIGSYVSNGVTWNRIKRTKGKNNNERISLFYKTESQY